MKPINSVFKSRLSRFPIASLSQAVRFALNFNGVNTFGRLLDKMISFDGDNLLGFYTASSFSTSCVIISQNITGNFGQREFMLFTSAGGSLVLVFGGASTTILTAAQGLKTSTKYGLTLIGTEAKLYEGGLSGTLVKTVTFVKGSFREPAAVTKFGCNSDGVGHFNFFSGPQYDIEINGVRWPMAERNQSIQLPSPSGLGPELITQAVLEKPAYNGSQWSYLGSGRWQYIGDGTLNALNFLSAESSPEAGFLQFDIESITGGTITCAQTPNGNLVNSVFGSTGTFRYYYATKGLANSNTVQFKRANGAVSCIIKNISLRALRSRNAVELITNGDFSAGAAGWSVMSSGSLSVSGGLATLTTAAGQASRFEQGVTLEPLAWYEYSADLISFSGVVAVRLQMLRGSAGAFRQILGINYTSAGKMSFVFQAPASDAIAQVSGDSTNAGTVVVDNVSLRKLDSICNPLVLNNVVPEQWQQVPA